MNGEWCYFKSYLNKDTCEQIIKDGLSIPSQDAVMGLGNNVTTDYTTRRSKVRFINKDDWRFTSLFDTLWKTGIQANNDFFNIHLSRLEFIQLAEYDSSYKGEYKTHHDVFWINNDPFYHRKMSCVIQLSDPNTYTGGDLEFPESIHKPDSNDLRQQGSLIFFPSMIPHKANPVLTGTRYSIAAWFEGPKWR